MAEETGTAQDSDSPERSRRFLVWLRGTGLLLLLLVLLAWLAVGLVWTFETIRSHRIALGGVIILTVWALAVLCLFPRLAKVWSPARPWQRRLIMATMVCSLLAFSLVWFGDSHGRLGLGQLGFFIVTVLPAPFFCGMLAAILILGCPARRKLGSEARRAERKPVLAVAMVVLILLMLAAAATKLHSEWQRRQLQELLVGDAWQDEVLATRQLCHEVIRTSPTWGAHDAYLWLLEHGDASSVPVLIDALWWAPRDGFVECQWDHAAAALAMITNRTTEISYEAWQEWYEQNRHASRLQWIAAGFRELGLEISADGGAWSILRLFGILGIPEWPGRHEPPWILRNATLLLDSYEPAQISEALQLMARGEIVESKRGAAPYLLHSDLPQADEVLQELRCDPDRSVRFWAGTSAGERRISELAKASGNEVMSAPPLAEQHLRAGGIAGNLLYYATRQQDGDTVVAHDLTSGSSLWRSPLAGGARCSRVLVQDESIFLGTSDGRVLRLRRNDGEVVWSRRIGAKVSATPHRHGQYLVVSGKETISVLDSSDGTLLAMASGALLQSVHQAVLMGDGQTVRALSLPRLELLVELQVSGAIVGTAVTSETVALLLSDADADRLPLQGSFRIEGYAITDGQLRYRHEVFTGSAGHGLATVQTGPVLFVSLFLYTAAIAADDGRIVWETGIGTGLELADDEMVVVRHRGMPVVLGANDGSVRQAYHLPQVPDLALYRGEQQLIAIAGDTTVLLLPVPASPAMAVR